MYSRNIAITIFAFIVLLNAVSAQSVRGVWYWTWSPSANVGGTTINVAFSGLVDPTQAMSNSASIFGKLVGNKYLALGGGNGNGHWTSGVLQTISSACSAKKFSGYVGLALDIEEGDAGLANAFKTTINNCKSHGYKILITTSHSAPYGFSDAGTLMQSFFSNSANIDYMSPQLYTSGTEGSNDYTDNTVSWSSYSSFSGKLVPSIVAGSYYSDAQAYFSRLGIQTVGYVQWSQTAAIPKSPSTPPPPSSHPSSPPPSSGSKGKTTTRCGSAWGAANLACGKDCKTNADCPGSACWTALSVTPCTAKAIEGSSETYNESSSKLAPYVVLLVVTGSILFVVIVIVVAVVVTRRNASKKEERA